MSLVSVRAFLRNIESSSLTSSDINLLEEIAQFASSTAQDARIAERTQEALIEVLEQFERYGFDAHAACGY